MTQKRIVVMGATGHVGSIVAARLLDAGEPIRVVSRSADRLADLAARGAEPAPGTVEDPAFLRRLFEGAHAAFVMLPPYPGPEVRAWQDRTARAIGDALEVAKVRHVVALSSIGAELEQGNGPAAWLHTFEARLGAVDGLACLCLRPGYFFENSLGATGMIRSTGANAGAIRGDLKMPQIASRDIGEVAARRLRALDWEGRSVQELHGERDLTMTELTTALGESIGRPGLSYVQVPYPDARRGLVQAGIPDELSALFMEMSRGFNEGLIKPRQPRGPATTTPTPIERWAAEVFAPVYQASGPRVAEESGATHR